MWQHEEVEQSLAHPNFFEEGEDGELEGKEIFQWFLVSSWLAEKLEEIGEPVLRLEDACWWGRTQCGIGLTEDETLIRIVENIQRSLNEAFKSKGAEE
jgi:hypothetical protein